MIKLKFEADLNANAWLYMCELHACATRQGRAGVQDKWASTAVGRAWARWLADQGDCPLPWSDECPEAMEPRFGLQRGANTYEWNASVVANHSGGDAGLVQQARLRSFVQIVLPHLIVKPCDTLMRIDGLGADRVLVHPALIPIASPDWGLGPFD